MYNIYLLEDPKQMLQSADENGIPTLTIYDTLAARFETIEECDAVIITLNPSGNEFWGTRPVRRPK